MCQREHCIVCACLFYPGQYAICMPLSEDIGEHRRYIARKLPRIVLDFAQVLNVFPSSIFGARFSFVSLTQSLLNSLRVGYFPLNSLQVGYFHDFVVVG